MYRTYLALCACTLGLLGCDTKTQIIDQIVQVPPPEPPSTPLVIDVQASQVDGSFLLDGGTFPNPLTEIGEFALFDLGSGTFVDLGKSYDQGYDLMIVHGNYDSVYRHGSGSQVPANQSGVVQSGLAINNDQTIDIDVSVATIQGFFALDGGAFPVSAYNRARFYLQPVGAGDLILLGESHVQNDPVSVMPGTYDVVYRHFQGALVPANEYAVVMSNVVVIGNMRLDIDIDSVDVRTSFLHNGSPFPQSQYIRAEFFLVDNAGDRVLLGNSYDAPGTISAIGGTYDVEYQHIQGASIPLNSKTTVVTALDLSTGGDAAVDVPSFSLDINATLNGQPFPVSEYDDGILEFRNPANGSYSLLGNTHNPFTDLVIIPGTYDIAYSHETGNAVPLNTRGTVFSGYVIAGDQQLDLDVTGHTLTTALTLDNNSFPLSNYEYGDIYLQGDASAEDIRASATKSQDAPFLVLPGTYDVIYSCHNCNEVPFNSYATILDDFDIIADGVIATNVESVRLDVTATLNGNPFPQSIYESGLIHGGLSQGDTVELTTTAATTEDVIVIAGDYTFYYEHQNGTTVPINSWTVVDQQAIGP